MQNPNQMISKTMIFDEVALGLAALGLSEAETRARVEDTLRVCGLYPFRNWPISALSFGQKKRVTIAGVLAMGPELIILDEANIMVRGLSGDAKTIQACISRYLDNLQAKFQVDRRAAEAYFKSRTQMTDSTVQRYTQFDKSLIDDVKEFFQNGTISHAQALSLCPLEPSEQVLYVNAVSYTHLTLPTT